MSRRKISSESFSSLGSDYLETSPEEESECPVARLFWNGSRSPPAPSAAAPAGPPALPPPPPPPAALAPHAGSRRAPRRRRVNLDSLGESVSRLTAPTVRAPTPPPPPPPAAAGVALPKAGGRAAWPGKMGRWRAGQPKGRDGGRETRVCAVHT